MKTFFQKHPVDLDELTAIKVIRRKLESAEIKCKEGDESYLNDLAKVFEQIEDFFSELETNPASLL
jgi:hypothetical protein